MRHRNGACGHWRTSCSRLLAGPDGDVALVEPSRRISTAEARSLPPEGSGRLVSGTSGSKDICRLREVELPPPNVWCGHRVSTID